MYPSLLIGIYYECTHLLGGDPNSIAMKEPKNVRLKSAIFEIFVSLAPKIGPLIDFSYLLLVGQSSKVLSYLDVFG